MFVENFGDESSVTIIGFLSYSEFRLPLKFLQSLI